MTEFRTREEAGVVVWMECAIYRIHIGTPVVLPGKFKTIRCLKECSWECRFLNGEAPLDARSVPHKCTAAAELSWVIVTEF